MLPGVYLACTKAGKVYYRASITYLGKHISLGSYATEAEAGRAYREAQAALNLREEASGAPCFSGTDTAVPGTGTDSPICFRDAGGPAIGDYPDDCALSFHKWVVLINFRDNGIYFKNPIYLKKRYFLYYLDQNTCLRFDAEDLFYYAHHKIMRRGGHLFVSDYGMQVNILSRYGIKNYAVPGKDYVFANGDNTDYSYYNIEVINPYRGVTQISFKGMPCYLAKIHINGDYLIGRYQSVEEAAIAYNKAALLLRNKGMKKNFPQNFIEGMDAITYASVYQKLRISKKLIHYAEGLGKGQPHSKIGYGGS
ncbi:hypothetical protein HNQ56_002131 [Anaerotaenia torta]|uniref:hypothetical protein n=1 Tax=Anaerotaenia torta TaxID=433293 RepID=UPI003D1D8483